MEHPHMHYNKKNEPDTELDTHNKNEEKWAYQIDDNSTGGDEGTVILNAGLKIIPDYVIIITNPDESYYGFKDWCKQRINVNLLHRLKYVTNIFAKNVQKEECQPSLTNIRRILKEDGLTFDGNSEIFSNYQSETHQDNILRTHSARRKHIYDVFLSGDIDNELYHEFQPFDLMTCGKYLGLFVIDQLKQGKKDWKLLGSLFNLLPYTIAKEITNSTIDFIQYVQPDILQKLCHELF
eukprot:175327_1